MISISYNKGGGLITFFKFLGFGYTVVDQADERSITLTIKLGKVHTFFTFAII